MGKTIKTVQRMFLFFGASAVAVLFAVWFAMVSGRECGDAVLANTEITVLDGGWQDEEGNSVSLPIKLPYRPEGFCLQTVLRPEDGGRPSLMVSAKYLNIHLFLDGREIGSCLCRPEGQTKTVGKIFKILPLPDALEGSELRIVAEPLLGGDTDYEITAPRMGTEGAIIHNVILEELPLMGLIAAIFCFGVFLMICGVQTMLATASIEEIQTYQSSFLHIGVFAVLFAFYSLSITDSVHLFETNSHLIYLMEFLLLALLPLPLLMLAAGVCAPRFFKILTAAGCAVFINFGAQVFLYYFTGLELRDTVLITHLLILLSMVLLTPALLISDHKRNGWWWLTLSFLPVLLGAFLDLFRYYLPGAGQKAAGFQLGVLIFLLIQMVYLIRQNLLHYESYLKFNVYKTMAYTDVLTGIANRAACEEKITEVEKKLESYSSIWCICADINNLKHTNDTLGHAAGDQLIKGAAEILKTAGFEDSALYRTGGDEFVMLVFNQSEKDIREGKMRFDQALTRYNSLHRTKLSIAWGCDRFRFESGDSISKLLSRADALMYEDKRREKEAGVKKQQNNTV